MTLGKFYRLTIICPHCKEKNLKCLVDLESVNETPCDFCGAPIDLTIEDRKAEIADAIEDMSHFYTPKLS